MSQAKISRIERGKTLPSVIDVERMLAALDVPADAARELVALARRANVEYTSWRSVAEIGLWRKQAELQALAESCRVQRLFLPAIPSGLLQVPEYATEALSPVVASSPARDVGKAVRARLERQKILDDASQEFVFLLTEQAVRWKRASRRVMAKQAEHMAELSKRDNIDIAIIPQTAEVFGAALNTFVVYDERLVIAELFSGEVVLRDHRDVRHHLDLFEYFYGRALVGDRARAFLLSTRDEFM
jgi:transcriptional regulator with XRE-family HTH domain